VSFDTLLGQSMCARTTLAQCYRILTCLVDLSLIPTPSTINAIRSLDLPLGMALYHNYCWALNDAIKWRGTMYRAFFLAITL